jgi:ribonuclease HII
MRRALEALGVRPDYVVVDALHLPGLPIPQDAVIGGDRTCAPIAAASIVAKVHRDGLMRRLHQSWPAYGFALHKGYGTTAHLEALRKHGASPVHRLTFRGVRHPDELLALPFPRPEDAAGEI